MKRIAAVEGETVQRNGVNLTVPKGQYYVLGDNVNNSLDSRYWVEVFLKREDVVAKLVAKW